MSSQAPRVETKRVPTDRPPIRPLETPRLLLKPLDESDAPRIQLLFPQWEVLKYMAAAIPWPYPDDGAIEHVRRVLPKVEAREEYHWAITLKEQPDLGLIGAIGLTPYNDRDNRGFWLAQEFWGQGLMREAAAAVTDFAFDDVGMTELMLNNAQPNTASHRLKESAGAEIVSTDETADFIAGTFPTVRWLLTREAWKQSRRS